MTTALQSAEQHAECLREQADEVESIDTVEMAIVGATMRNAADAITQLVHDLRLSETKLHGEEAIRRGAFDKIVELTKERDALREQLASVAANLAKARQSERSLREIVRRLVETIDGKDTVADLTSIIADARKVLR